MLAPRSCLSGRGKVTVLKQRDRDSNFVKGAPKRRRGRFPHGSSQEPNSHHHAAEALWVGATAGPPGRGVGAAEAVVRAQLSADRLCSGAARPERGATCAPEQTVARRPRHTRGSADWSAARERAGRGGLTEGARRSTAAGGEDRRARWLQPGPLALSVPARAHSSLGPRTEAYDARGKKGVPWARWCAVPVRTRPEQPGLCSAGTALQRGPGSGHVPRPVVRVAARRVCKRTSKRA